MKHHYKKYLGYGTIIVVIGILFVVTQSEKIEPLLFSPTSSDTPIVSSEKRSVEPIVVLQNLSIPWDMAFISQNEVLVTERTGTVLKININSKEKTIVHTSTSSQKGEGGLLGIVLHPSFSTNNILYLYETYQESNQTFNRVIQYSYFANKLNKEKTIIDKIPGATYHDGGRMAFGPDGKLYTTTGDATQEKLAQNLDSLAGKILRMNDDGSLPSDNPFSESFVYSYGHRNPQGLAWDSAGQLWSTEHGPSGLQSGYDELNKIVSGGNYGWPLYEGNHKKTSRNISSSDYIMPELHSGPNEVWAPASLAYSDGYLYWGGLRGESIYKAEIQNNTAKNLKRLFTEEYGRIRFVHLGPNNEIYFSTSNTDGRGNPRDADDIILKF